MTHAATYAWIVLSLGKVGRNSPVSLLKIISTADRLNKAIPSHAEMQLAIGWLLEQGLIHQEGRNYALTQLGRDLIAEVHSHTASPFDEWDFLKKRFVSSNAPIELANISELEWQQACDTYVKNHA